MKRLVFFVILMLLWLLLTLDLAWRHVVTGAVMSLIAALLFGNSFVNAPMKFLQPRRYFWFLNFSALLLKTGLLGAANAVYRVFGPVSEYPSVQVRLKTDLRNHAGLTLLACAATFAPGILGVDVDPDAGNITLDVSPSGGKDAREYAARMLKRFEPSLAKAFE